MTADVAGDAVCTCSHVPGYHQSPDFDTEFYVCGACDKPTRMYLEAKYARAAEAYPAG